MIEFSRHFNTNDTVHTCLWMPLMELVNPLFGNVSAAHVERKSPNVAIIGQRELPQPLVSDRGIAKIQVYQGW